MMLASDEREDWRAIPGCASHEISSLGRARLAGTDEIVKLGTNGRYRFVKLRLRNDERRTHPVHSIVLLAFVGPRPREIDGDPDVVCNHMDCSPRNNRPGNLEYTTNTANIIHGWMVRKGRVPPGTPAAQAVAVALRDKFLNECCTVCLGMGRIPRQKADKIEACSRCKFVARRCRSHGGERRRPDGYRLGAWHDLLDHIKNHCAAYAEHRRQLEVNASLATSAAEAFGTLQMGVAAL